MPVWSIWLLSALALVIVEFLTTGFGVICFSFGCLGASLTCLLTDNLIIQIAVFSVISLLCFIFLRPVLLKLLQKDADRKELKTNADALIEREGVVSEAIPDGGHGRVRIDGDEWKSISVDGAAIAKGTKVKVISRDGIILTVEKI